MRRKAYAKITLFLNSYRNSEGKLVFDNIIAPIDLFDMVYLEKSETMILESNKDYLPNNKKNTVYKCIQLMKQKYKIEDNFHVRIVKNIPSQSGLGGGSANAAAVIHILNEMYQLNMDTQSLIDIAKEIDEDTPYCLFNQLSRVSGIGDKIETIETDLKLYYLLIKPSYGTSTKSFLRQYKNINSHPGIDACINSLETNNFNDLIKSTYNSFENPVMRKHKNYKKLRKKLESLGLEGVCMSGSGTSIYGLTTDKELVMKAYDKISLKYAFVKYGSIKTEEIT